MKHKQIQNLIIGGALMGALLVSINIYRHVQSEGLVKLLGIIGIDVQSQGMAKKISNIMVSPILLVTPKKASPKVSVTMTPIISAIIMTPMLTPILSPSKTPASTIIPKPSLTPTPIPYYPYYSPTPSISSSPISSPTLSPSPSPSSTPTPLPSPTLSPSSTPEDNSITTVVINEIAWMGTKASDNDEWIELYNATNHQVNLDGWTLRSKDGTPNITLSGSIGVNGFYLLERTSDSTISDISADKIYTGALGNGGEFLELKDASGNLQDSLDATSGWPAGANPSGNPGARASMERINQTLSGNDPTNWGTNNGTIKNGHDSGGNPINGTPKSSNSV